MEFKIISIQSRKGGVGKTTVALNLARLALKKNFVVYLDLDFTGTEAKLAAEQPIWAKYTNCVEYLDPVNKERKSVNLPELYNDYLNGLFAKISTGNNNIPNFDFNLQEDQINIFNSKIDNSNIIKKFNIHEETEPYVLYDNLHCTWFLDFVKDLILSFKQKFDKITLEKKIISKNLIIIIDNSPGYTGYQPYIEEWITDIGPINGKFLFVSSLDSQDLIESIQSLNGIHEKFIYKLDAGKLFCKLVADKNLVEEEIIFVNDYEENYFSQLIEFDNLLKRKTNLSGSHKKDSDFDFPVFLSANIDLDKFLVQPQCYLGLVINKVPKLLFNRTFDFNLNFIAEIIGENYKPKNLTYKNAFKTITEGNCKEYPILELIKRVKDQTILYDENIEIQFLRKYLMENINTSDETNKEDLLIDRAYINFKANYLNVPEIEPVFYQYKSNKDQIELIFKYILLSENIILEYSSSVEKQRLLEFNDFWRDNYFFLLNITGSSKQFLARPKINYSRFLKRLNLSSNEIIKDAESLSQKHNVIKSSDFHDHNNAQKYRFIINYLSLIYSINKTVRLSRSLKEENTYSLFVDVINKMIKKDNEIDFKKIDRFTHPSYWIEKSKQNTNIFLQKEYSDNPNINDLDEAVNLFEEYKMFCSSVARLLRLKNEYFLIAQSSNILFKVLRTSKKNYFNLLREILDNLILHQEISIENSRRLIKTSMNIELDLQPKKEEKYFEMDFNLASADDIKIMILFENVLKPLLKKQWQLT